MSSVNTTPDDTLTAREVREILGARTTWTIDPAASRITFSVRKRLMFVARLTVTGSFPDVSGTITMDESDPTSAQAEVSIAVNSVRTGVKQRDKHLLADDWFAAARHPHLTFRSRRIEELDAAAGRYRVTGDLTVRGVTRPVALDAPYTPAARNGTSAPRLKLSLSGSLNRHDFGLSWNKPHINVADAFDVALEVEAQQIQR